jgi:hypothetical protein
MADDRDPKTRPDPTGRPPASRIVYLECKSGPETGTARIGRVTFSKSRSSVYYRGRRFERTTRATSSANYFEADGSSTYWISGCKRDGRDRLFSGPVEIDEDVREEYRTEIRRQPERRHEAVVRDEGQYGR